MIGRDLEDSLTCFLSLKLWKKIKICKSVSETLRQIDSVFSKMFEMF